MEEVFLKLDQSVETALQHLFPATTGSSKDTQQRAQEFSSKVTEAHTQLTQLKTQIDSLTHHTTSDPQELEQEIQQLRQDIRQQDEVLQTHRKTLAECVQRLQLIAQDNQQAIQN